MQQSKNEFDVIGMVLVIILILIFFVRLVFPKLSSNVLGESIYYIFVEFFLGLFFLYSGIRALQKQRAQQIPVRWYTQPSILVALALFFTIPFYLIIGLDVNFAQSNGFLVILLWLPSTVLLLAAIYFYIRGFLSRRRARIS